MGADKRQVIQALEEMALLMELKGENPFKARAHHNAARTLKGTTEPIPDLVASGRLQELPGIGQALLEKITALATTGSHPHYEELRSSFPAGVLEMLRIPGLGPKKIRVLWETLEVSSPGELEYACHENRLVDLPGFGARSQSKILKAVELFKTHQGRFHCHLAQEQGDALFQKLRDHPAVTRLSLAGSLRRRCETSKDIDLVASSQDPAALMNGFVSGPDIVEVTGRGTTKSSVRLVSGMSADLRVVSDEAYPFALHHFTGSKEHNVALRGRAAKRDLKLNEYGLFQGEEKIQCPDEEAIFSRLGLQYIPPELRENFGEIEAAEQGGIPDLVTYEDLRGVLHVHTNASDGSAGLLEMAEAARRLNLEYLGVCDHSKAARYAGGLDEKRVREQHLEIDQLNPTLDGVTILKGIEVDILRDGALDFSDEVLAEFDFVVASVHSAFHLSGPEMTQRIIKAIRNPYISILGHPTGRLLLAREPYAVDLNAVIQVAAEQGVCIELNSNPQRLDIDWRMIPAARSAGVMISINPDAHQPSGLADMRYGVGIARKGWLTRQEILNAMALPDLLDFFDRRRS